MPAATTQRSIIIASKGKAVVSTDASIPTLRDDYVLVRVTAVALNPTDFKHVDMFGAPGSRLGCDYAGVVEEVGTATLSRPFKKGDRIAGFAHGGNGSNFDDGAFAEYVVAKTGVAVKIPDGVLDEDAATLGVGITTVGQALFLSLGLPLPGSEKAKAGDNRRAILIYGGSTATGTLAIQYAKLAGYEVVTTCSPRNFDLVRSLGADSAYDYNEWDAAKRIRERTGDSLDLVLDCIADESTAAFSAAAIGSKGGVYSALLGSKVLRDDVESRMTLAYTALGEAVPKKFGQDWPASPADYEFQVGFWGLTESLLREKKLKTHPAVVGAGGLDGVLDGLDQMRQDKVSGKKLVYRIADTSK